MKVSFLMLTIDRYEITKKVWENNLINTHNFDLEFLICDNGSEDKRIIDYFKPIAKYHRVNFKNEGIAKAFNQLYLRSSGEYIVCMGNDIALPYNWLSTAISYLDKIHNPGLCGFDWGHSSLPPLSERFGIQAHWTNKEFHKVFGSWIFKRSLIDDLGFFYDNFDKYGLEDSEFNERVFRSGYNSFYLPGMKSEHLCHDVGQSSEYRKMKDIALDKNYYIMQERLKIFDAGGPLTCPLPEKRDSL